MQKWQVKSRKQAPEQIFENVPTLIAWLVMVARVSKFDEDDQNWRSSSTCDEMI